MCPICSKNWLLYFCPSWDRS